MPKALKNIIGLKSGRLTIIEELPSRDIPSGKRGTRKCRYVKCLCDCGNTTECRLEHIRRKNNPRVSCGCIHKEGTTTKHGQAKKTKTYNIWQGIKSRCNNPNNQYYYCYGGKGISYDPRWEDFQAFYDDMGDCPQGYSIERLDIEKNYCKENCTWIPLGEQARNTSLTKLNWDLVRQIRAEPGEKIDIAHKYAGISGVDFRHIYKVLNNEVWKE